MSGARAHASTHMIGSAAVAFRRVLSIHCLLLTLVEGIIVVKHVIILPRSKRCFCSAAVKSKGAVTSFQSSFSSSCVLILKCISGPPGVSVEVTHMLVNIWLLFPLAVVSLGG